jgi:CRP/FNR family transcriptional regulator, cyclic AMP receptor protein
MTEVRMTTLPNQTPTLTSKHPFLVDMDPRHVEILLHGATEQEFEPGEIIFREGEPANRFYLIAWGEVALETKCPADGTVLVQTLRGGEVIGWSWLFAPFAWNFQARAIKQTRVVACDGAHLLVRAEEDARFGRELMRRVARVTIQRLQGARTQLIQMESALAGKSATLA